MARPPFMEVTRSAPKGHYETHKKTFMCPNHRHIVYSEPKSKPDKIRNVVRRREKAGRKNEVSWNKDGVRRGRLTTRKVRQEAEVADISRSVEPGCNKYEARRGRSLTRKNRPEAKVADKSRSVEPGLNKDGAGHGRSTTRKNRPEAEVADIYRLVEPSCNKYEARRGRSLTRKNRQEPEVADKSRSVEPGSNKDGARRGGTRKVLQKANVADISRQVSPSCNKYEARRGRSLTRKNRQEQEVADKSRSVEPGSNKDGVRRSRSHTRKVRQEAGVADISRQSAPMQRVTSGETHAVKIVDKPYPCALPKHKTQSQKVAKCVHFQDEDMSYLNRRTPASTTEKSKAPYLSKTSIKWNVEMGDGDGAVTTVFRQDERDRSVVVTVEEVHKSQDIHTVGDKIKFIQAKSDRIVMVEEAYESDDTDTDFGSTQSSSAYKAALEATDKEDDKHTGNGFFQSVTRVAEAAGDSIVENGIANFFFGR